MTNKAKFFIVILFFSIFSLFFGEKIKVTILNFCGGILESFYLLQNQIKEGITEHFNQLDEINKLRKENKEFKESAILLTTFADKLEQILQDKNSSKYDPKIKLAKTLSYLKISDYNKFWVSFDDFNQSKVYGAIFEGNTIGVVVEKNSKPLVILQNDENVAFSVFIGKDKIPGVVTGDNQNVLVKFIPKWLNPKIGDKIYTSGLDNIFFSGIGVGEVEKIIEGDLYKSVVVKPYVKTHIPAFIYIITKEN